jgi:hypothetical protein
MSRLPFALAADFGARPRAIGRRRPASSFSIDATSDDALRSAISFSLYWTTDADSVAAFFDNSRGIPTSMLTH